MLQYARLFFFTEAVHDHTVALLWQSIQAYMVTSLFKDKGYRLSTSLSFTTVSKKYTEGINSLLVSTRPL